MTPRLCCRKERREVRVMTLAVALKVSSGYASGFSDLPVVSIPVGVTGEWRTDVSDVMTIFAGLP